MPAPPEESVVAIVSTAGSLVAAGLRPVYRGFSSPRMAVIIDQTASGLLRVGGAGNGGYDEPAVGLRLGEHGNVVGFHATAHDERILAHRAHFVDGGDVQRGDIAIFVDDHALGLRGRHVQWAGSYVVDGAFGQMVGFAHFVDGFRRQSNDRVRWQLSCHHWIEVVLTYVHPSTLMPLARASSAASTRSSTTKATECST